jgi:hypothetical protein
MNLSLNSVIHYTGTLEKLKGILTETFKIKYCLEVVTKVECAFPVLHFSLADLSNRWG